MVKSMTGYGRARETRNKRDITVEVRSVNNRYLDCTVKLPRAYVFAEDAIKGRVQKAVSRGKVDVFVTIDSSAADVSVVKVNEPLARSYYEALLRLKETFGLSGEVTPVELSRCPDVLSVTKAEEDLETLAEDICQVTDAALAAYNRMRSVEGVKLAEDIAGRADTIEDTVARVEAQSPQTVSAYRERLEKEKEAEIEKAREKARSIVEQVRYQADQLMNELEELKKQKDSANFSEKAAKMRQSYRSGIRKLYDSADPVTGREKEKQNHNRALKRGDIVIIPEFNKEGTVLTDEDKDGYVMVQAGIIKTKAPAADLRLVDRSDRKVTVNNQKVSFKRNTAASGGGRGSSGSGRSSTEVDVRGMTTDEAIMEVDRFLDSCVLSHIGTVTVIHGKGTGTLRAAIQQHLKRHPSVRSFRTGVYGEGENGVTIVELK